MGDICGSKEKDAADRTIVYKDMNAPPSNKVEIAHTVDNAPGRSVDNSGVVMLQIIIIMKILEVMIIILIICKRMTIIIILIEASNTISSVYVMKISYCFCNSDWWRQSLLLAQRLIFGKQRLFTKIPVGRLGRERG